jgi:DNA end-binding protein Ku
VRSADEYLDEIQDVKVTKDMLDLAKHIVNQKSGRFEPDKFEDQYEMALVNLINTKRSGKPITPEERSAAGNVVDLMDAESEKLRCSRLPPRPRRTERRRPYRRAV